jgi:hypothetical protein
VGLGVRGGVGGVGGGTAEHLEGRGREEGVGGGVGVRQASGGGGGKVGGGEGGGGGGGGVGVESVWGEREEGSHAGRLNKKQKKKATNNNGSQFLLSPPPRSHQTSRISKRLGKGRRKKKGGRRKKIIRFKRHFQNPPTHVQNLKAKQKNPKKNLKAFGGGTRRVGRRQRGGKGGRRGEMVVKRVRLERKSLGGVRRGLQGGGGWGGARALKKQVVVV